MAIQTEEIPREELRERLDELARSLGVVEATIEVDGADVGAQIAAERLTLTGISYDDRANVLAIALEVLGGRGDYEHFVDHPTKVYVARDQGRPIAVEIEDGEGRKTIVSLEREPAPPAA